MAYDLTQNNYHIAPGDILLLRSITEGRLNRTGQLLQRGRKALYTHVAVVISPTRIIDAMPNEPHRDLRRLFGLSQAANAVG